MNAVRLWSGRTLLVATFLATPAAAEPAHVASTGSTDELRAVWGSGKNDVYAVSAEGTVLRSVDQGKSWISRHAGVAGGLYAISGAGPTSVYALGPAGILRMHESGAFRVVRAAVVGERLEALWAAGPEDLYVVGDKGLILHSTDGGAAWTAPEAALSG